MPIGFNNPPKKDFPNRKALRQCLDLLAKQYQKKILNLQFVFVSDDELLEMNRNYLNHNYYTDIITFDQSEDERKIEGDVFISVDRVLENALNYKTGKKEEFVRVCCHGLLHLCGLKDKSPRQTKEMRLAESQGILLYNDLSEKANTAP
jgi:probable rRNA maturation factor